MNKLLGFLLAALCGTLSLAPSVSVAGEGLKLPLPGREGSYLGFHRDGLAGARPACPPGLLQRERCQAPVRGLSWRDRGRFARDDWRHRDRYGHEYPRRGDRHVG